VARTGSADLMLAAADPEEVGAAAPGRGRPIGREERRRPRGWAARPLRGRAPKAGRGREVEIAAGVVQTRIP